MADSVQIHFYVSKEQKERWEEHAEEYGTTLSGHIRDMVEAGMKKFDRKVEPRESVSELREQRNALRRDLRDARDQIETLEDRLDEVTAEQ